MKSKPENGTESCMGRGRSTVRNAGCCLCVDRRCSHDFGRLDACIFEGDIKGKIRDMEPEDGRAMSSAIYPVEVGMSHCSVETRM